jgi:hypothetical protein
MIVKVDAGAGRASLEEPEDCRKFHIEASGGDADAVARALGSTEPAPAGHAWVPVAWVREQAAGRVGESWPADFDAMVGFARSKGWLDGSGAAIQAHIEWV